MQDKVLYVSCSSRVISIHFTPIPQHKSSCAVITLLQVKLVLQKLAGVNGTPMIAMNEAVELLCKHLSVNYCR